MLLYFVKNVFFKSKIILSCVIIAIQHTSSSETSARKTKLAKQDRGRKRPLRKTRCRKFPVKLVLIYGGCYMSLPFGEEKVTFYQNSKK